MRHADLYAHPIDAPPYRRRKLEQEREDFLGRCYTDDIEGVWAIGIWGFSAEGLPCWARTRNLVDPLYLDALCIAYPTSYALAYEAQANTDAILRGDL